MIEKVTHEEAINALKEAYGELLRGKSPTVISEEDIKDAMKEAFKELLDEKATSFGYFSMRWIVTFLVGGAVTYIGIHYGLK